MEEVWDVKEWGLGGGGEEQRANKEPKSLGCWNAVLNNNENIKAKMLKA